MSEKLYSNKGYQDKQQKDNNQINVYDKVQCRVSVKSHGWKQNVKYLDSPCHQPFNAAFIG